MPKDPQFRRLRLLASSAFASLAISSAAAAQDVKTDAATTPPADSAAPGGEIVVTATRQAQSISRVPLSISAFSQEKLDAQGIKQFQDVVRFTPGLNFSESNIRTNVSIRGISSTAGAATTGIYIDDTPIQVRTVGTSSQNPYPVLFDVERVEVLRGPQGTLFGAGSEGGTVRFIQPQPSLTKWSAYARSEIADTQSGAASYELGGAVGGPIIQDKIGFRASVYYRHDGGWISRETGLFSVLDSTGRSGPNKSLLFNPTGVLEANSNWQNTFVSRLALAFQPTERLTFTPAVVYQHIFQNDHIASFPVAMQDYGSGRFYAPAYVATVDATHNAIDKAPANGTEPTKDWYVLPSMHVEWEAGDAPVVGALRMISNSSYFSRTRTIVPDYTQLYETTYARRSVALTGDKAISPATNHNQNFTQEVRFQTDDPSTRVNLVVGGFYSYAKQEGIQNSEPNFITQVASIANTSIPGYPTPPAATTGGAPFGAGTSAYVNYYGEGLLNGVTSYYADIRTRETQAAVFGQADFKITSKLKFTAGVRYSYDKVNLVPIYDGPNSNLNAPHGLACLPGTGLPGEAACSPVTVGQYAPGTGPFVVAYESTPQHSSGTAVTPKFSVSYQADRNKLFYLTAAKGFRPGGAQQRQPSTCDYQLASLGYVDSTGHAASPTVFGSDSLWSYEGGTKLRLFGGRVTFDASAYLIKWTNIQTSVSLSTCAQSFFDNLGSATGRGFDLDASVRLFNGFVMGVAAGYNKTTFDSSTILGGRQLYTENTAIPDSPPPWRIVVSGQYDVTLLGYDTYARADYTYTSRALRTSATDPLSVSYDAYVSPTPPTNMVNGRLGVKLGGMDISLFMNNMFDAHPHLALTRTSGQPLYSDYTFQPRTTGLTVAYRY